MSNVNFKNENGVFKIFLEGHIDSSNAPDVEKDIRNAASAGGFDSVVVDCDNLKYISSAGLRVILRLKKDYSDVKLINVSSDVYEVFDMTGFTEILEIQKAYRKISVEGCEVIGQGANGKVYRIDMDTIVKVYFDPDSLPEIHRERELARKAFVMGIPTAIPYDVVRVGDGYGSVFELLNAQSFAKLIINDPSSLDELMKLSADLLHAIHSTELKPGDMPDMRSVAVDWVEFLEDYLPADKYEKLHRIVLAVPEDHHMLHGDYHIKNIMRQNGETLLIDMDTLCMGHPIFEFGSIYNAYLGFSDVDRNNVLDFLGIDYDTATKIWEKTLKLYFEDKDDEFIESVKDKATLIGHTRIMRRLIRRNGLNDEFGRKVIENSKNRIIEMLDKVDSLTW